MLHAILRDAKEYADQTIKDFNKFGKANISIKEMENKLSDRIAKVIDEKLEGMDEVVVELIRCKTDNETLRQKIIDLNKEIYQLKNDVNSFKHIGLGMYRKKERSIWD